MDGMNTSGRPWLICTVGGSHEPILHAIRALEPERICFVCSGTDPATGRPGSVVQITGKGKVIKASRSEERPTLPNIPALAGLADDDFEVLEVSPDDFDDVYSKTSAWLKARAGRDLVADYTGGTKTMSAALVAAALDQEQVRLQLVTGSRGNLQQVVSGSEMAVPASVETTRFQRRLQQALVPWSRYAWDESADLISRISPPHDSRLRAQLAQARDLSRAFTAWDRFDHQAAHNGLQPYRAMLGRKGHGPLMAALDLLVEDTPAREPMRLFDLWHNARRRARQQRYDDAVARLYRLLEWSAQWLLRERAGIDTADVPEEKIPPGMNLPAGRDGKRQAGLFAAWELAAEHAGVREFWQAERDRVLDLVRHRNFSILAHGMQPLTGDDWKAFSGWIEEKLLRLLKDVAHQDPWRIRQMPPQLPDHWAPSF